MAIGTPALTNTSTGPTGTQDVNLTKVGGTSFSLGQQLAASSLPIVLTAAQLSTLTPLSTVAATQSGTWSIRAQDGAGNALTSNSTTYTAKFGLDSNLLGTKGTAFSTAGKVDVKVSSGDIASGAIASGAVTSGAVASGAFSVGSIAAGAVAAGPTSFVKLEDVASADGDAGVPQLAVRKATPANTSGTDGDYEFLQMSNGRLWTSATVDTALPAGGNTIGGVTLIAGSTDYYPMYNRRDFGGTPLATDPSGALVTRGSVVTDEGAQRVNFTGAALSISPGTATFTNGSTAVTGSGFTTTDLNFLDFIKLGSDSESAWAQVAFINSDTSITLFNNYTGTGGTGTYNLSPAATVTGSGATITVGTGQLTIASGNTAATNTIVYTTNSSPPLIFETSASVSQRIVNQDIYMGIESALATPFRAFARFHFTGTTNTQVVTETGYNPTTTPSASETETNTITLPAGATTASANVYKINMNINQTVFTINGVVVATHTKKMPHKNVNVYYCNLRFANGTTPATSTNIVADYILAQAYSRLDTYQPLVSVNSGAVDNQTQRVVQPNNAGKTLVSASGSASSNGNNTLVSAGTTRLKVYAFALTTTSSTAVTCIFQSGASGTELWRYVLQAPTGVSVGANMSVTPPAWLFATASATLLNLNLSGAIAVNWSVSYYDEV